MNLMEESRTPVPPPSTHLAPLALPKPKKRKSKKHEIKVIKDEGDNNSPIVWSPSPSISTTKDQESVRDAEILSIVSQNLEKTSIVEDVIEEVTVISSFNENQHQSDENNISPVKPKPAEIKKVKKKKKRIKDASNNLPITSNASTISAALNDIIDTVEITEEKIPPVKPPRSKVQISDTTSEISLISDGKIFVQHGRTFAPTSPDKAFVRVNGSGLSANVVPVKKPETTAMSTAIAYQKAFLPLSMMCHGLLAGVSIWQCITVFNENKKGHITFVETYSGVASLFQAVFYVLVTISLVAILDKCNFGTCSKNGLWELVLIHPCYLLALLSSCGALITSSITAKLDDRLALHIYNETLWLGETNTDEFLREWFATNLARCILAIISFLMVSLCWGKNSSELPFPMNELELNTGSNNTKIQAPETTEEKQEN